MSKRPKHIQRPTVDPGTSAVLEERRICIALDTNQWLPHHMLRVGAGASQLHAAVQLNAVIGFPEITERELKILCKRTGLDALARATRAGNDLSIITGKSPISGLPTEDEVTAAYKTRIEQLKKILIPVQLTMRHVKRALDRVIAHLPPCGQNNEQFRDSVTWEAVLELSEKFNVHFVTSDKAFFEARDPSRGLASNLLEDANKSSGSITAHDDVVKCLTALQKTLVPLDEGALSSKISEILETDIQEKLSEEGFNLVRLRQYSVKGFPTGKPAFTLTYSLVFDVENKRQDDLRRDAQLTASGECIHNSKSKAISDIRKNPEKLVWSDEDGTHRMHTRTTPFGLYDYLFNSGFNTLPTQPWFDTSGSLTISPQLPVTGLLSPSSFTTVTPLPLKFVHGSWISDDC